MRVFGRAPSGTVTSLRSGPDLAPPIIDRVTAFVTASPASVVDMDVEAPLAMSACGSTGSSVPSTVVDIPPSMETNSGDSYTLTDLSSCHASTEDQPLSNGFTFQNDLFAELDYERPSTSGGNANGIPGEFRQEEYDPIYNYYYMMEDSHEDVLKKLEDELLREEVEEQAKAEAAEKRMMELEKGAEEFLYIKELKKKRDGHVKMSKEKKAEKERIIQLRKELAMANREREIFCCFVCSRVFVDEESMREHVAEKHLASKKEYFLKCSKCYQRFNKRQHLQRHEQTHKNTACTCRVCKREFRGEISLKIHMSSVHSMSLGGVKISRELECKCGRKFGIIEELKRHKYYCETRESIAEKRRKAREELDAMSSVTVESSPPRSVSSCSESTSAASIGSASGRPVKDKSCPFCFLVCASMQSRRRHIQRIHPEKLGDEEVDQHSYVKVQSPALPYACELCAKTFASHASLSTHRKRIHENRNDHECTICGRRYPLPSELRKHIKRVHEKNSIN